MLQPRFTLLRELGHGGEGRVVAVRDAARAGIVVALKETHGPSADALAREFELLATLRHQHLAEVYEYFPVSPLGGARAAYTQRLVAGVDLYRALRDAPELADVLVMQLLMALGQLHAAGLVHLDLKPDNVLVEPGDVPRARLVDFGIAARIGTKLGLVRGSRSYVAPEILAGEAVAPTADLFSLGIALAEIGLGSPVVARELVTLPREVREARLASALALPLARLTAALVAAEPSERPRSAAAAARLWGMWRNTSLELVTAASATGLVRSGGLIARDAERAEVLAQIAQRKVTCIGGVAGAGRTALMDSALREAERQGYAAEAWPLVSGTASAEGFGEALARLVPFTLALALTEDASSPERWVASLDAAADAAIAELGAVEPQRAVMFVRHPELATPSVRAFLRAARRATTLPLAFVVASEDAADIALGRVDAEAVRAFVASRFGPRVAGDATLVSALASASGGLTGHLEALLELLVAQGAMKLDDDGWHLVGDASQLALSAELTDAIASRVALLGPNERAVLMAIAALSEPGQSVAIEVVDAARARSAAVVLDDLLAMGLIRRDGDAHITLGHAALAQVLPRWQLDDGGRTRVLACSSLAEVTRARLEGGTTGAMRALDHARRALTARNPEAAGRATVVALWLATAANDREAELAALSLSAEIADRLGPREAQLDALRALLTRMDEGDPRRLDVEARLFWTLTRIGDPSFESRGEALVVRAQSLGRALLAAEVAVHLAIVASQRGEQDRAERLLVSAREGLAETRETLPLRARISNNIGNVHMYRREFVQAQAAYREAHRLKLEEGDPVGERIALGNLALMSLELGAPATALDELAASYALARRTGHRRGEAWSLLTLAEVGLEGASPRYAKRRAAAAAALAETLGDQLVEGDARTTLAEALLELGELSAARDEAARGEALARASQNGWTAARARTLRLLADAREGRAGVAAELSAVVDDATADATTRSMAARFCAETALAQGDIERAVAFVAASGDWTAQRCGVRWAALLHTRDRVIRATGAHIEVHQWLADWVSAWPADRRPDGVDAAAIAEGPSRQSVLAHPSVAALLAHAFASDSGPSLREASMRAPTMADPPRDTNLGDDLASLPATNDRDSMDLAQVLAAGSVADLQRAVTQRLVAIIRALDAERAILVTATDGGVAVLDARDSDGEAIAEAQRRLSEAVTEAVQRGLPWRAPGPDGRGAVAIVPWRVMVGGGAVRGAVVLQNRFVRDAFDDLSGADESITALQVLLRASLLEGALSEAHAKLSLATHAVHAVEVRTTEEIRTLRRELESTREQLGPARDYPEIVFASGAMKKMLRQVDRVVATQLPVHIHGESGTGKELVARAVHQLGDRSRGPFVPQNCSAIPPTLFESELFGHERGAFTGAMRSTEGLFRRAHGGTLFLDEIGDLPMELQAKLLRVLETGEVRPVGATRSISVDVRIVSATHRDLAELITRNAFREDLYYRLNVIRIEVPALRERPEDIPVLIEHFLARRGCTARVDEAAMRALVRFAWPGNVRQLENEVARATLLADKALITLADLSPEISQARREIAASDASATLQSLGLESGTLKDRVDRLEAIALENALRTAANNKSEVARTLGLSRAGLNLKLKRLGLWDGSGE